jgi:hypothetical protein
VTSVTPLTHKCITQADPSLNLGSAVNILALVPPATLRQAVIRPALSYLGISSRSAENLLLGTLMVMAWLPPGKQPHGGIGPYSISRGLHTRIWDDYLAKDPEVASLIRGLASQRCFLQNPHGELGYNLAYATAIAWLVYQQQPLDLSDNMDINELAQLWHLIYPHHDASAIDFIECWNRAAHDEPMISV